MKGRTLHEVNRQSIYPFVPSFVPQPHLYSYESTSIVRQSEIQSERDSQSVDLHPKPRARIMSDSQTQSQTCNQRDSQVVEQFLKLRKHGCCQTASHAVRQSDKKSGFGAAPESQTGKVFHEAGFERQRAIFEAQTAQACQAAEAVWQACQTIATPQI